MTWLRSCLLTTLLFPCWSLPIAAETTMPIGTYVGQLQERWAFPSDHLPIGLTVEDFHIASWNVLDAAHMSWVIEKDTQGLGRSIISQLHVYMDDTDLTLRDIYVATLVENMLSHATHPRSLVCLQECSPAFVEELKGRLSAQWKIVSDGELVTLVDRSRFEVQSNRRIVNLFSSQPKRFLQEVVVRDLADGMCYRLYNAHLPGDPLSLAYAEFASFLAERCADPIPTIAMGDMNFNECEMAEAFEQAFAFSPNGYQIFTPYCTNISPDVYISKAIDHFIVFAPESLRMRVNGPEEVLPEVAPALLLLQGQ